jgi:hypothetical protein
MHVDVIPILVPIATEIGIEVMGEPVIEPKIERVPVVDNNNTINTINNNNTNNNANNNTSRCSYILDWIYICFLILIILGIFGGLIALLVWLNDPSLFAYSPT